MCPAAPRMGRWLTSGQAAHAPLSEESATSLHACSASSPRRMTPPAPRLPGRVWQPGCPRIRYLPGRGSLGSTSQKSGADRSPVLSANGTALLPTSVRPYQEAPPVFTEFRVPPSSPLTPVCTSPVPGGGGTGRATGRCARAAKPHGEGCPVTNRRRAGGGDRPVPCRRRSGDAPPRPADTPACRYRIGRGGGCASARRRRGGPGPVPDQ